jgi:beta-glucosidase/6-phospho-beta-glucosidase/beta-galactosidase
LFAHYLTEITHSAYMRLLLTGEFALKVPFLANESFELPEYREKATRPLDFIGGQYYTDPLVRFPQGSVTRNEEEALSVYGYRAYPQGLVSALEELKSLEIPIDLTEVGIDRGINKEQQTDAARIAYFEKVLQAAQVAINQGIDLRSIYWWTRDRSWEWHAQMNVDFSWYDDDGNPRPVVEWLRKKLEPEAIINVG